MRARHWHDSGAFRVMAWLCLALLTTSVVVVLALPPRHAQPFPPSLQAAMLRQIDRARGALHHTVPLPANASEVQEADALLPAAANAGILPASSKAFFVPYQGAFLLLPRNAPAIAATMLSTLTPGEWRTLVAAPSCAIRVGTNFAGALLAIFACAPAVRRHPLDVPPGR